MVHRVLGAAGRVFGIDLDRCDRGRFGDVLLLKLRDQRAEPARGRDDDRHRPFGAEMEETGDIRHADRMEQHERVELAARQFGADAFDPGVVFILLNLPPDRRGRLQGGRGLFLFRRSFVVFRHGFPISRTDRQIMDGSLSRTGAFVPGVEGIAQSVAQYKLKPSTVKRSRRRKRGQSPGSGLRFRLPSASVRRICTKATKRPCAQWIWSSYVQLIRFIDFLRTWEYLAQKKQHSEHICRETARSPRSRSRSIPRST